MAEKKGLKISGRLTREEWLARSLDILSREGESKLRLKDLVRKLGVTTGSFYWHFRNREDFVRSLAEYWAESSTDIAIREIGGLEGDARARLLALAKLVTSRGLERHDLMMRVWGTRHKRVARIVQKVDRQRLAFVRSLFAEMGFRGEELEIRTRVFVVYHSLERGLFARESRQESLRQFKKRLDFFTRS